MRKDTFIAAGLEAGLLSVAALLAFVLQAPLIFSSLGPTAYEMIELPERPSAQPYHVLVGHGIGVVAGLLALLVTHAWQAPALSVHQLAFSRVLAVLLAGLLTVIGTLAAKAAQPAALSTTLLIALGSMQTGRAVLSIVGGVVLLTVIGEPIRRMRLRAKTRA